MFITSLFDTFVGLIEFIIGAATLLGIAFLITLAMPESQTKDFAIKAVGWIVAACCGLYVAMPFDALPEGLLGPAGIFDDLAAAIFGVAAAYMARKRGKNSSEMDEQLTSVLRGRTASRPVSQSDSRTFTDQGIHHATGTDSVPAARPDCRRRQRPRDVQ